MLKIARSLNTEEIRIKPMPRISRILIENAYYHVISRGNQKQKVFASEQDYFCYLGLLRKYKSKFHIRIYGYCLMPNHVHLVLQPQDTDRLSAFMKGINQSYALHFNLKYEKCGHLWQGRFKSMVIGQDCYLVDCIEYVEMNPVRANLVKTARDYQWSSYRYRVFGEQNSIIDYLKFAEI